MKTPDEKQITMTFHSHPTRDLRLRWTAKLAFPAGATGETMLPITFVDGCEGPVEAGTFEFAGLKLRVKDGRSELSYADFIRGKHEKALWLHRPGREPIPGGLTFE